MKAEEILQASEDSALENNQIITHVTGKKQPAKIKNKAKSFGAVGFLTLILVVVAVLFSSGNIIPSAISERLIEETDVQYADAVESKKLVFQQAMQSGELPENTKAILEQNGYTVGTAENGSIVLTGNNKTITADNFITEVSTDANLYSAFNNATYSRAAYYYDDSAKKVFKKIGTTRNNYTDGAEFNETMEKMVGSGSDINVNNVATEKDEENNIQYVNAGGTSNSDTSAGEFINGVSAVNTAGTSTEATLNSADTLKVADTISKEQRSSLFYLTFMENISKMKAGEGNESRINEAMNYLYEESETEIVDVETGETIKVKGTALESPSLYSILAGGEVDTKITQNYSSERILKTVENKLGTTEASGAISGTVASTNTGIKGSIGRFLNLNTAGSSTEVLNSVNKTVDSSLVNNSYSTISGVSAGEFLVEGAVNVGKELAKASGATAGDAAAVASYARLTSTVLAMDAAADRIDRSPFDITSKNTFLGSIIYKVAVASMGMKNSLFKNATVISNLTTSAVLSLLPTTYADETDGFLTEFGDCETYQTMLGAVGTTHCSEIATFDTSTLNNTFNDAGFINFVNENTTLSASGTRTVNSDSVLADFILYNNERTTPMGIIDGGILSSLSNGSSSVGFLSDFVEMIKSFLGADETNKRIASGAEYVNSSSNPNWSKYKYAQRYVSLARATESLRQYADSATAYNNIFGFEGAENPVVAFIESYNQTAQR